ncbi:MAG TPA: hypothetical protein VK358_14710 [Longimicrobium sp.]|nr:hypothetical protein [Longimicrobium sp.]
MKEPRPDDERLSALLDGRLKGQQRDELLAYLAANEEDYDVFVDTADILREAREENAQAEEPGELADPPPRRELSPPSVTKSTRGWPRRTPRWAVISTVLVGLVVVGVFTSRAGAAGTAGPVDLVARLEHAGSPPAGWMDGRSPRAWRGTGTGGDNRAAAARAGVFLVRLAVAVQARDSKTTGDLAAQMQRFDRSGGTVLRQIVSQAGASPDTLMPLVEQATERLEEVLDRDYLRLGAWTEAASLAARTHDEAFFRSAETRKSLRRAERLTREDQRTRGAVEAVRASLPAEGPPRWNELNSSLTMLFTELTR